MMSASSWMRRHRDRPIAEHERRTAMAAVVVLLATVTVLLTLTQPTSQAHRTGYRKLRAQSTTTAVIDQRNYEAKQLAERFLTGYLAYTYGRAPASRITGASASLIASLEADPPRVLPAARARRPRIVSLHLTAAPAGELAASAVVNDGGLIDFTIRLLLATVHRRLFVIGVEGA